MNKSFKLLAIRPRKGCDKIFLKNLKEDYIYKFYNTFDFLDNKKKSINSLNKNENLKVNSIVQEICNSEDLYDINSDKNHKIRINISAIVGKNGSGKSSLIELLYVCVYLLSVETKILERHDKKTTKNRGISRFKENLNTRINELDNEIDDELISILSYKHNKDSIKETLKNYNELNGTRTWNEDKIKRLDDLLIEINELRDNILVDVFYLFNDKIYLLKFGKSNNVFKILITVFENEKTTLNKKWVKRVKPDKDVLELNKEVSKYFFYSLVLNYSQYALNSKEIGNWITELFHKNDGYQTPIVINPMRFEGNYDINRENELLMQRLLVNILTFVEKGKELSSLRHLAQGHIVKRMQITLNEEKFKNKDKELDLKYLSIYNKEWDKIVKVFSLFEKKRIKTDWDKYAREYIFRKLISMSDKYPPYKDYFKNKKFNKFDKYLEVLSTDNSHIAYKFYQAVNFLKYDYAITYTNYEVSNTLDEISEKLNKFKTNLIQYIPPPFLNVSIYFDEHKPQKDKDTNTLANLSSGEKQYVFAISSIMYHLRYLDSVDDKKLGITNKYEHINLMFDEVELYYHPEFQRQFINDFLEAVKRCKLQYIKAINCVFITHSPFILSDIPKSNILMLEKGEPINKDIKTFAANIHEMLGDSFFLDNGYVGEFVKRKIESLLYFYSNNKPNNESSNTFTEAEAFSFISLIDDKLISERLMDIHNEYFNKKEIKPVSTQIDYENWLTSEIIRIKNKQND